MKYLSLECHGPTAMAHPFVNQTTCDIVAFVAASVHCRREVFVDGLDRTLHQAQTTNSSHVSCVE